MAAARQGDLFSHGAESVPAGARLPDSLPLLQHQLLSWQNRLGTFQEPLFEALKGQGGTPGRQPGAAAAGPVQGSLFAAVADDPAARATRFDPLALAPQTLQFWRWPDPPQQGAALYVVMDRPPQLLHPLLLYVGETGCADRRWKGEHDCKTYLAAYAEALQRAGLAPATSIRFWCDVPAALRPRRALEQALIRLWQPPFNKETRQRWATPFTAELP